jgi:hypothetical protein
MACVINLFKTDYILSPLALSRSRFLVHLFEENNEKTPVPFSFRDDLLDCWEWIYLKIDLARVKNRKYFFYPENPSLILRSVEIINYFDIDIMMSNIFYMINNDFFTTYDLLYNYQSIYHSDAIKVATHLCLIKRYKSVENLVEYLEDSPFGDENGLFSRFYYLDTLSKDMEETFQRFQTRNIPEALIFQRFIFQDLYDPFVLLKNSDQKIFSLEEYDLETYTQGQLKWIASIIPGHFNQDLLNHIIDFENQENQGNALVPDLQIAVIDFENGGKGLSFIDPNAYIYIFINPFTGLKHYLAPQKKGNFYLSFDNNHPLNIYPINSTQDIPDLRLKKLIQVGKIDASEYIFQNGKIFFFRTTFNKYHKNNLYVYGKLIE